MLSALIIKNFATISQVNVDFSSGMTVITGDTGAGKSLLLSALNLVLGGRTNADVIRQGCDKVDICAVFNLNQCLPAKKYLIKFNLNEQDDCIMRRVIAQDGRSKMTINSIPVSLSQAKNLSAFLINIYGQNTHQKLLDTLTQQQLLDNYVGNNELLTQLNDLVGKYQQNQRKIKQLSLLEVQHQHELDLLSYQLDELETAQLDLEEISQVEQQYKVAHHAQRLLVDVGNIQHNLEGNHEEVGIQSQLNTVQNTLDSLNQLDPKLQTLVEQFNTINIQLQEANYEMTHYLTKVIVDEQENERLGIRLSELNDLARKHSCQIPELLTIQNSLFEKINTLKKRTHRLEDLENTNKAILEKYQILTNKISANRVKLGTVFAKNITQIMQTLGMPIGQFQVKLIPRKTGIYTTGNEMVSFEIRINRGQTYQTLSQVASGGELSRINLAVVMAVNHLRTVPTLVFDEVDAGISGGIAQVVGQSLRKIASQHQVLCITHLAQVGAQGHHHLLISKQQSNNQTYSNITPLTQSQRVVELARILDGVKITQSAKNVAKNLLKLGQ